MTAIDSSIDLQFKNSRLDAKAFGEFYASAMSAAMQQTTQFLIQEKQLVLDKARVAIAVAEYNLKKDNSDIDNAIKIADFNLRKHNAAIDNAIKKEESKYNVALTKFKALLTKAQTKEVLLRIEDRKKKIPLELSALTQETKAAEKKAQIGIEDIPAKPRNAMFDRDGNERPFSQFQSLNKGYTNYKSKPIQNENKIYNSLNTEQLQGLWSNVYNQRVYTDPETGEKYQMPGADGARVPYEGGKTGFIYGGDSKTDAKRDKFGYSAFV